MGKHRTEIDKTFAMAFDIRRLPLLARIIIAVIFIMTLVLLILHMQ